MNYINILIKKINNKLFNFNFNKEELTIQWMEIEKNQKMREKFQIFE